MILVNDVHSSRIDGATASTVTARIRVIELLGLPPPTEMFTPSGLVGDTGEVGAFGPGGAAKAGEDSTTVRPPISSVSSATSPARLGRRPVRGRAATAPPTTTLTVGGPSARASG